MKEHEEKRRAYRDRLEIGGLVFINNFRIKIIEGGVLYYNLILSPLLNS